MRYKRGDIKEHGKDLLLKGLSVDEVAEHLGATRDTILTYNKRFWKVPLKKKMDKDRIEIARQMIVEGYKYEEIEEIIGFKASSIRDRNDREWRLPYREIQAKKKLVERTCKTCGIIFYVRQSKLKHDACDYCSKKCSHIGAIKPNKINEPIFRGYRWPYLSQEIRKKIPFCLRCGSTKNRLIVHHILPWRLGGRNNRSNLLVLCDSCHKQVEDGQREMFGLIGEKQTVTLVKVIYSNRLEGIKWNLTK